MTQQNNKGDNMNIETVANGNDVSKAVFKALSEKQRAVRTTSLTNLFRALHKTHKSMSEKEFLDVFKQLEQAKYGKLIIGRRSNHDRFEWNYNLKDVAQLGSGQLSTKDVKPAPKLKKTKRVQTKNSPFNPPVIKTTESSTQTGPRFQFDIVLSPSVSATDIQALVELVQSLQNKP